MSRWTDMYSSISLENLTDDSLRKIGALSKLTNLYLKDVNFTPAVTKHLSKVGNLQYLHITDGNFDHETLMSFASLPKLKYITVSGGTRRTRGQVTEFKARRPDMTVSIG